MKRESALRTLARRAGVLDRYRATTGQVRFTSDDTRVALLAAMGLDASDAAAARRSLEALETGDHERLVPPVGVMERQGRPRVRVHLPPGGRSLTYEVEVRSESGERQIRDGTARNRGSALVVPLPAPRSPHPGYYLVRLTMDTGSGIRKAEQLLVVPPRSCTTVREVLGNRRVFGLIASLYTVRSERDCGVGDLAALRALVAWAGEIGAGFVGINPLYATGNAGDHISPYRPISRLIRNPLYLEIAEVPELGHSEEARALMSAPAFQQEMIRLRHEPRVEYQAVVRLKQPVLEALYRTFVARHGAGGTDRGRAYRAYCDRRDPALTRIATFLALDAHFGQESAAAWPAPFRDPASPRVAQFAVANAAAVDYHRFVQFEMDRQLSEVHATASGRLPIGVFGDLPLGCDPGGADPWAFPGLFVTGAHLGAPPDAFIRLGQDWGLPPIHPGRLLEQRLEYWIALVRHALAHSGALRLDHVMGLFRQFWIPAGRAPAEGAYLRFPAEALLAVLAIESRRQGALVIGEDLGTVPRGLGSVLARWGILSTRVLYFARHRRGGFDASRKYSRRALVTANTHDQIPLAGFWSGRDLEIQHRLGLIGSDLELARARRVRAKDRQSLVARLARERCMPPGNPPASTSDLAAAVHCLLARTPAPLVGVSLEDLTGEREPVNVPGVSNDRYPNWSRRLGLPLEALRGDPAVRRALSGLDARRWPRNASHRSGEARAYPFT